MADLSRARRRLQSPSILRLCPDSPVVILRVEVWVCFPAPVHRVSVSAATSAADHGGGTGVGWWSGGAGAAGLSAGAGADSLIIALQRQILKYVSLPIIAIIAMRGRQIRGLRCLVVSLFSLYRSLPFNVLLKQI